MEKGIRKKDILIGLIFGGPVGAVGAMTVQRTWEHGIKAGLLTGMGNPDMKICES